MKIQRYTGLRRRGACLWGDWGLLGLCWWSFAAVFVRFWGPANIYIYIYIYTYIYKQNETNTKHKQT